MGNRLSGLSRKDIRIQAESNGRREITASNQGTRTT